jgi:hypothetical protein
VLLGTGFGSPVSVLASAWIHRWMGSGTVVFQESRRARIDSQGSTC